MSLLVRRGLSTALAVLLTVSAAHGQFVRSRTDAPGLPQVQTFPQGTLVLDLVHGDSLFATLALGPNEDVRLIVVFDEPPLALHRSDAETGLTAAQAVAVIDAQHARFRTDVAAFEAAAKQYGSLAPATTVFRQTYRTALNGVAVTTERWMAGRMASLPYVRGVYEDRTVEALDDASNRVIGADRAHQEWGTTGRGVRVAVIDTGIDYTHPALGGGFGPGFKVEGGYDFVDDDNDPMDANGHGTHVAGIVAGDDGESYVGVAPGARLLAYRVLDADGYGEDSAIIAAIERAVDPDGDPATDDAVDVMNLSLGGTGGPDDPSAQAIDNATAAGIVCVVAAGNAGQSYAIGSPGVARSAITVGASDNQDVIAAFSSRGPVALTFENKPDLLAPGVAIQSSVPGGVFDAFSGTSMATPHVAGVAALLLERHPTWDPATVKGVLMHSARDIGERLWTQGTGRIDVMAADALPAVAMPATLSFGNVDPVVPEALLERTLILRNLSDIPRTFTLSASHSLPGLDIQIQPARLVLAPDEAAEASVTARITTALFPQSEQIDAPFTGEITATDGAVTLRVSFSVMKTPQLVLTYDEPPHYIVVLGSAGGVASVVSPGQTVAIPLPRGTYDVVTTYQWNEDGALGVGLLVNENVAVNGRQALQLSRQQALHTVRLAPVDRDGQPLMQDYGFMRLIHASGFTQGISGFDIRALQVSDLSPRFKIEYLVHNLSHPSGDDYVVPMAVYDGVTAPITLTNDPAAYGVVRTRYAVPPGTRELFFMPQVYQQAGSFSDVYSFYVEEQVEDYRLQPPFMRTVYYAPIPGPDFGYRSQGHEVYNTTDTPRPAPGTDGNLLYLSPILRVSAGRMETFAYPDFEHPLRVTEEGVLDERLGGAPLVWAGRLLNGPGRVQFNHRKHTGLFLGNDGDIPAGPIPYTLQQEDEPADEGSFFNDLWPDLFPQDVAAGRYTLHLAFEEAFLDERAVRADALLTFDTEAYPADINPPHIERLVLTSGGSPAVAFDPSRENVITAILGDTFGTDDEPVAAAQLSVRRLSETDWTALDAVRDEDTFTAAWPSDLAVGYYALHLFAGDQAGNTLDYRVDPAFRFGAIEGNRAPDAAALLTPSTGLEIDLDTLAAPLRFTWRRAADPDDGQQLRYALRLSGPDLDVRHVSSDTTLSLDVKSQLRKGGTYTWSVETTDGFTITAGVVFTFVTKPPASSTDSAGSELPGAYVLSPNYPNPFNPTTTVSFSLPEPGDVRLEVFDVLSRRVAVLAEGPFPAGRHTYTWTAIGLPSGVYYARLQAGAFSQTRQMVLLK